MAAHTLLTLEGSDPGRLQGWTGHPWAVAWAGVGVWFLCHEQDSFPFFGSAAGPCTGQAPCWGSPGGTSLSHQGGHLRWDPPEGRQGGLQARGPLARRKAWASSGSNGRSAPGLRLGELRGCWEPPSRAGGPGGAGLSGLVTGNEWCAVPGVGEDEPVIIFKFAIIDLGKSYRDKNELIIKFISEINSAAIKKLAGAPGPRAVPPSRPPSPQAKPGLARGGWGRGRHDEAPQCPRPLAAEGAGGPPGRGAKGQTHAEDCSPAAGRLPSLAVGAPRPGRRAGGAGISPRCGASPESDRCRPNSPMCSKLKRDTHRLQIAFNPKARLSPLPPAPPSGSPHHLQPQSRPQSTFGPRGGRARAQPLLPPGSCGRARALAGVGFYGRSPG